MYFGIDLGGTKIEAVAIEEFGSEPILRHRIATEAEGGYSHILDRIEVLVRHFESQGVKVPLRIGMGIPGSIDPASGLVRNANTTCLIGQPLAKDLQSQLGRELVIENDANCFALAETTLGATIGREGVFGVIMGTGVGGAMVVGGSIWAGSHGIAGEWGHNVLEPGGRQCYCGKRGCVETVLSGPALEQYYFGISNKRKSLKQISAGVESDSFAAQTIDRLCEKFGEALSVVVNIFDPDAIVLGGGVGNISALYSRGRAALRKLAFHENYVVDLLRPSLGDSAGVFGAALLVKKP